MASRLISNPFQRNFTGGGRKGAWWLKPLFGRVPRSAQVSLWPRYAPWHERKGNTVVGWIHNYVCSISVLIQVPPAGSSPVQAHTWCSHLLTAANQSTRCSNNFTSQTPEEGVVDLHCVSTSLETVLVVCSVARTRVLPADAAPALLSARRSGPDWGRGALHYDAGKAVPQRHRYCTWREAWTRPDDTMGGLTDKEGGILPHREVPHTPKRSIACRESAAASKRARGSSKAFSTISPPPPNIVRTPYFLQSFRGPWRDMCADISKARKEYSSAFSMWSPPPVLSFGPNTFWYGIASFQEGWILLKK